MPGSAIHMVGVGSSSLRVHDNEIAGASTVNQASSPFFSDRFESAVSASVDVFVQPGATLALDVHDNHFTVPSGRTGATAIRIGTRDPGSPTATVVRLSVDGNRFDGLDGRAIDVIASRGTDVTLDVDANVVRTSGAVAGGGFLNVNYGFSGSTGRLVVSMDDNDISAATGDAVAFLTSPDSALSFTRNRFVDSAGRGVFVDTREGVTRATFTGNDITGSRGVADVVLETLPFGTARIDAGFEGNTIGTIRRR